MVVKRHGDWISARSLTWSFDFAPVAPRSGRTDFKIRGFDPRAGRRTSSQGAHGGELLHSHGVSGFAQLATADMLAILDQGGVRFKFANPVS